MACLAYRGRAITVGNAGRDTHRPEVGFLSGGNRSLTGVSLTVEMALSTSRVHTMIAGHLRDVASGALRVLIDRTYPLSEAAEAHTYIESRQAVGRVLLSP
jgi:NADPH2:quinone reductase